jgi:hypothetical protein
VEKPISRLRTFGEGILGSKMISEASMAASESLSGYDPRAGLRNKDKTVPNVKMRFISSDFTAEDKKGTGFILFFGLPIAGRECLSQRPL